MALRHGLQTLVRSFHIRISHVQVMRPPMSGGGGDDDVKHGQSSKQRLGQRRSFGVRKAEAFLEEC
jgi:hypothetical protein